MITFDKLIHKNIGTIINYLEWLTALKKQINMICKNAIKNLKLNLKQ